MSELIAAVILVDDRGWLLLQERDEHAPVDPDVWGLVGGHVEPGESWTDGVRRELLEETGLEVDDLVLWHQEADDEGEVRVWVARTTLRDADVTVGEGRQIVFVDPERVRDGSLDIADFAGRLVRLFLDSETYRLLAG